jgi:DNA-binding NarL/FixJ family response regulator
MNSRTVKILIIEDHPIMGNAICSSVASQITNSECEVVTTLAQALNLLQAAKNQQLRYTLIVTDLNLPDSRGLDTLKALKPRSQDAPIVVLSMDDEPQVIQDCKMLAVNYISKSDASNQFETAIHAVFQEMGLHARKKNSFTLDTVCPPPDSRIELLTPKQNCVLAELAQGYSNKEIARRLCVSDETVRGHLTEIFKRLSVQNRTQATKYYLLKSHIARQV